MGQSDTKALKEHVTIIDYVLVRIIWLILLQHLYKDLFESELSQICILYKLYAHNIW